ncbi:hypothetical protein TNCV_1012822 [Trichonephila clavipes]|uniref:Uncharacterized protein n=1 Tax=Trichonephila clavipes TaxID=2585209 RepID=A0A8X6VX75_TRICX|nr:hypothetical protein TNCV_1012822 [Trichonephila clavipes]
MPSPVQSNCDAHDTIANGQYGAVWSMGHTQQVTIGIAFQASITAEVSACNRGSEKVSPVFEHPFRQTTPVQASMCEWSSYPAGREMGLSQNIAIELGVQHCAECPHASQSSCFQSQELTDPGQTTGTPLHTHHYASTTKLNSRHNAVAKETFAGHSPNPDASIRLPDCKARFITPQNSFPTVQ